MVCDTAEAPTLLELALGFENGFGLAVTSSPTARHVAPQLRVRRGEREPRRATTILIEMDQLVRKSQSKLATADLLFWFLLCQPRRMRVSHSGIDGPDEDVRVAHFFIYSFT